MSSSLTLLSAAANVLQTKTTTPTTRTKEVPRTWSQYTFFRLKPPEYIKTAGKMYPIKSPKNPESTPNKFDAQK